MNRLGIEMLTLLGMNPVDHVKLAADLGCVSISTGLTSLPLAMFGLGDLTLYDAWSLTSDAALRRELTAALADTGVHIGLGEGFRIRPDGDIADRAAELDVMAGLGALRINAVSMETDMARTHDQLAVLADMVLSRGMQFLVEFAPPNAISSLSMALEAAHYVGGGRCQIMLDTMHLFRSGGTVADVRALDPAMIGYAQLCDVPLVSPGGTYMQEAMFERMVPGTGELPLKEFLAAIPADLEVGLEVPNLAALRPGMSARDHAAQVVAAARELGF